MGEGAAQAAALSAPTMMPGANIERRRKEDARVQIQKAYAAEANKLSFVALWQEKQERTQFLARTTKHTVAEIDAELMQANKDLLIVRKTRLRELMSAEDDQYRRELAGHGL